MIAIVMSLATITFAQRSDQQRQGPPSAEEIISRATEELSLSDEQVKQWEEIHENYGPPSGDRSKDQETRQEMMAELEATLTEEQLEKFKEMRPGGQGRGGRPTR